jgi:tannase
MYFSLVAITAVTAMAVSAVTLDDVCTESYVKAHLPSNSAFQGITINISSVTANPVTNATVTDNTFFPNAVFDYCNVSFSYSHAGLGDTVVLTYWIPDPAKFQNRYLATGGGGYAINSGNMSVPGGVIYGAVAGYTDGGFGIFQDAAIEDFLVANGTINLQNVYMFGYQAIHEQTIVGKAFTQTFLI